MSEQRAIPELVYRPTPVEAALLFWRTFNVPYALLMIIGWSVVGALQWPRRAFEQLHELQDDRTAS